MHATPPSEEDEEVPLDEVPLEDNEEEDAMGADKAFHRSATLGNEKLIQK